jgi:hypothetical protein
MGKKYKLYALPKSQFTKQEAFEMKGKRDKMTADKSTYYITSKASLATLKKRLK